MSDEDVCRFLTRVEAAFTKRLVRAWARDPESFDEYVKQLEDVIDLRTKICK
jgi:hypothetical protein